MINPKITEQRYRQACMDYIELHKDSLKLSEKAKTEILEVLENFSSTEEVMQLAQIYSHSMAETESFIIRMKTYALQTILSDLQEFSTGQLHSYLDAEMDIHTKVLEILQTHIQNAITDFLREQSTPPTQEVKKTETSDETEIDEDFDSPFIVNL